MKNINIWRFENDMLLIQNLIDMSISLENSSWEDN